MYENNRTNKLLTAVIVLLVLVLICLFLLMGTIVLSNHVDFTENDTPQTSQSEPAEPLEQQPEAPVKSEQPEEPLQQPEESSSSAAEVILPQAQPANPQPSGSSASSGEKETSEAVTYQHKTYKESTSDERKKTYGSVSVQAGEMFLAYKTVKGDMTISKAAEGGIELDHCVIEGTLYIKGGETVVLTNTRVGKIVVRDGYGRETTIIADGLSRTGTVVAYTDAVLDESGLESNRKGFTELMVAENKPTVTVTLNSTELTKATLKEETNLYLDESSFIETLRVEEPSVIDGSGSVEQMIINSDGVISYIVPTEEKKTNSRYDDVSYLDHNIIMNAPTAAAVTYDAQAKLYRFGWTGTDVNATGYAVELSAEGDLIAKTVTEPSVVIDDIFMNRNTTLRVRAVTTKDGYDPSAWTVLTYTPAQVGEIASFMVNSVEQDSLVLGWDAAANAQSYTLSWQQKGMTEATAVNDITGTSYTVEGLDLSDGKEYSFTLQVVGNAEARPAANGTASTIFLVKKLEVPVLSASYTDGLLTFGWKAVEGAVDYSVSGCSTEYIQTDAGFVSSAEADAAGEYTLAVKATGGYNRTEGVLYLDGEEAVRKVEASHLEMVLDSLKISAVKEKYFSVEWADVPYAAGYDVILTQNGVEVDRVSAVVSSYTYAAPSGDNLLSVGRDYTVSVSVKAPAYNGEGEQLYLNGSSVIASAYVREEHGLVTEGEGKTFISRPASKEAVLTAENMTMSDKYAYSLKLVVGQTEYPSVPYTVDQNGRSQVTFEQLMPEPSVEMPASYTIVLSASDKNADDKMIYLAKETDVLTVTTQ